MSPTPVPELPAHTSALVAALEALGLEDSDRAARALALEYAAQLDADPTVLVKIGSHYLAVLASLGLTPVARASLAKGGDGGGTVGLDDLSRLRRERASAG